MNERKYTQEVYDQINDTVTKIQEEDLNDPFDFIGDIWNKMRDLLHFLKTDNYKDDYQKFLDIVIDSHDTTLQEVNDIFEAVDTTDSDAAKQMHAHWETINTAVSTVRALQGYISGALSYAEASQIAEASATARQDLYIAADTVLDRREQEIRNQAIKELIGDGIKIISTGSKLVGDICSGNFVDAVVQIKKLGDVGVATWGDIHALSTLSKSKKKGEGLSPTDENYGDYLKERFGLADEAEDGANSNSISELLEIKAENLDEKVQATGGVNSPYYEEAQKYHRAATVAKGVDVIVDVYDVVKSVNDTAKAFKEKTVYTDANGNEATRYGGKGKYIASKDNEGQFNSKKIVEKVKSGTWADPDTKKAFFGIPDLKADFSTVAKGSKTVGTYAKIAGTAYSMAEDYLPFADKSDDRNGLSGKIFNTVHETGTSMFQPTSVLKDVHDIGTDGIEIGEDIGDLLSTDQEDTYRMVLDPDTHTWSRVKVSPTAPAQDSSCPVEKDEPFTDPWKTQDSILKQTKEGADQSNGVSGQKTFAGTGSTVVGGISGAFSKVISGGNEDNNDDREDQASGLLKPNLSSAMTETQTAKSESPNLVSEMRDAAEKAMRDGEDAIPMNATLDNADEPIKVGDIINDSVQNSEIKPLGNAFRNRVPESEIKKVGETISKGTEGADSTSEIERATKTISKVTGNIVQEMADANGGGFRAPKPDVAGHKGKYGEDDDTAGQTLEGGGNGALGGGGTAGGR